MVNPVFHESKYYYNSRLKNEKKKTKGLNEKVVDKAMVEMAESILLPTTLTTWSKNYLKELKDKEIADVSKVRESRNLHIKKLKKRKEKAKDAFLDGIFTKEEYQKEVEKLRMEEIDERTRPKEIDWFSIANSLTTLGREIIHIWQNGDIEEKRSLLDKLQVNHYWDEEKYSNSKPKSLELLISNIPAIRSEFALVEPVKNVEKQYDYVYMRMVSPTLCRTWDLIRTSTLGENDSV